MAPSKTMFADTEVEDFYESGDEDSCRPIVVANFEHALRDEVSSLHSQPFTTGVRCSSILHTSRYTRADSTFSQMTSDAMFSTYTDNKASHPINSLTIDDEDENTTFFPRVSYDDDEDDFMRRFFDTTVDGPCQLSFSSCSFPEELDYQLDLITHCRQPLHFLSFFQKNSNQGVEVLPPSAYVISAACEYCGASHVSLCDAQCQRPRLFFQKKRPPFCKPDPLKWDTNGHFIDDEENVDPLKTDTFPPKEVQPVPAKQSWVSNLFGSSD